MAAKYKEIAEVIERNIKSKIYDDKKKLPTEEELMKEFESSRNTIRKAIDILVSEGHIYRVQGSGVFIRETSKEGYLTLGDMKGFTSEFKSKEVRTKVIYLKVILADDELAEKMKCDKGTEIYKVKRIRIIDNLEVAVEYAYYIKNIVPYLNEEIAKTSIYKYITEGLKLNIGFADKIIYCEKLNKGTAEILKLDDGDPALVIEDTVYLTNGHVFNLSKNIFNYKEAKLLSLTNYK
ncbi:GntR family transcriptional regulator [Clostridium sp.]|uniref:GntR family transcriptional regulator n=1 Tax=Clostridium sp. TaxID=1506 RepID=UPI002FC7C7EA